MENDLMFTHKSDSCYRNNNTAFHTTIQEFGRNNTYQS